MFTVRHTAQAAWHAVPHFKNAYDGRPHKGDAKNGRAKRIREFSKGGVGAVSGQKGTEAPADVNAAGVLQYE